MDQVPIKRIHWLDKIFNGLEWIGTRIGNIWIFRIKIIKEVAKGLDCRFWQGKQINDVMIRQGLSAEDAYQVWKRKIFRDADY